MTTRKNKSIEPYFLDGINELIFVKIKCIFNRTPQHGIDLRKIRLNKDKIYNHKKYSNAFTGKNIPVDSLSGLPTGTAIRGSY